MAAAAAKAALDQIDALGTGDRSHLRGGTAARIAKPEDQSLGMCGFLHVYDPIRRAGGTGKPSAAQDAKTGG